MTEHPDSRRTVLVVDDAPSNIDLVRGILGDEFRIRVAVDGARGLKLAAVEPRPDLILLDVVMPGMDGYEVCARLKADPATAAIPVIFLTARTGDADEARGFATGALDYIHKPFSPPVVLARVRTHLALTEAQHQLRDQNAMLEERVRERTRQLSTIQDATIVAMASLAETRDNETGNHIRRTQHYVRLLASRPHFADALTGLDIETLFKSAPLHDIGKVGIPDHILLKPGKLTPDEFETMKNHAVFGRDAIMAVEANLDAPVSFLRHARDIAYCHHEKWDGSGYPRGLSGTDIPLSARLMAVADVYDALISRRVYKPPMPHPQAVAIIRDGTATHFDPTVVAAFLEIADEFHAIARQFTDGEA